MGLDPAVIQIALMAVQTIIIGGGGVAALLVMKNSVASIKAGAAVNKAETAAHFHEVNAELRELSKALITIARSEERINSLDIRVTTHGKQIDDMRRGIGYVSNGSRRSIDGEYP